MTEYRDELHSKRLFETPTAEIPKDIAKCPECGSDLFAVSIDNVIESGAPVVGGLYVECKADQDAMEHRYLQMDWQPVVDAVVKWCRAEEV